MGHLRWRLGIELRSSVRSVPVFSSEPYLQSKFLSPNDAAEKDQEGYGHIFSGTGSVAVNESPAVGWLLGY